MGTIDDLVSLSDHTWQRLRDRMAGLMDAVPMPRVPRGARPLRGLALSWVGGQCGQSAETATEAEPTDRPTLEDIATAH